MNEYRIETEDRKGVALMGNIHTNRAKAVKSARGRAKTLPKGWAVRVWRKQHGNRTCIYEKSV